MTVDMEGATHYETKRMARDKPLRVRNYRLQLETNMLWIVTVILCLLFTKVKLTVKVVQTR